MDTVAQQEEGEVWRHRLWGEGHLLDLVDLPEGARFRRRSVRCLGAGQQRHQQQARCLRLEAVTRLPRGLRIC